MFFVFGRLVGLEGLEFGLMVMLFEWSSGWDGVWSGKEMKGKGREARRELASPYYCKINYSSSPLRTLLYPHKYLPHTYPY